MFESLTNDKMLFAQVIYKSDSVQFINLLAFDGVVVSYFILDIYIRRYLNIKCKIFQTYSINDELIKYGYAIYVPPNGIYRNETTVPEIQARLPNTPA